MRGAPYVSRPKRYGERIIPADAGSTFSSIHTAENDLGSSPRMRGAPLPPHLDAFDGGIIPADAGSTGECYQKLISMGDHPRGCGEHWQLVLWGQGSGRIIPADAGSTYHQHAQSQTQKDHPRGCGEHWEERHERTYE